MSRHGMHRATPLGANGIWRTNTRWMTVCWAWKGTPLFLFDDPGRLAPALLDAIASSMPGARVERR